MAKWVTNQFRYEWKSQPWVLVDAFPLQGVNRPPFFVGPRIRSFYANEARLYAVFLVVFLPLRGITEKGLWCPLPRLVKTPYFRFDQFIP